MIRYFFSFNCEKQLIRVKLQLENPAETPIKLELPKWRPGRYQLQNFAKNILDFTAFSNNSILSWKKTGTNTWKINSEKDSSAFIEYKYFANEMNAGSSFVNRELVYLNPVNFCMFPDWGLEKAIQITIEIENPETTDLACGIPHKKTARGFELSCNNYYELFDSPIILSQTLTHLEFKTGGVPFHFWIQGNCSIDFEKLVEDHKKIAEYQIEIFGSFPEPSYYFMLVVPPNSYYHGVEHRNSTMMVLGENGLLGENSYTDLLGLTSHELFHTWNIVKIRPKELLPYDYTAENYFETCFVAEGFTTYFGDRILYDSGVFSLEQYTYELETILKRHFEHHDRSCQSLLESSFDLWVDGYEPGVPNKKVSVYHKGALAALILDSLIRRKFDNRKSLYDVMRALYREFGNLEKGYSYADVIRICENIYESSLNNFFETVIAGSQSIFKETKTALSYFGFELHREEGKIWLSISEK